MTSMRPMHEWPEENIRNWVRKLSDPCFHKIWAEWTVEQVVSLAKKAPKSWRAEEDERQSRRK